MPWDVIIVGGGPAGCAAAMVLARSRRRVLVIDEGTPRNIRTGGIHNYLTRDGIKPDEFIQTVHSELQAYNVTIVKARAVKAEALAAHGFVVEDNTGGRYVSRRLLVATGVTDNIPGIPGMRELWGKDIHHCPYCDGWESCDKTIGLYAAKFNGYGMSLALRQLTDKMILFTDTARYLSVKQKAQLHARDIRVVVNKVTAVEKTKEGKINMQLHNADSVPCDCIFTLHGNRVNNDLVKQLGVRCKPNGSIPVNKMQACNIPGVYLAGDVVFDMQFVALAAAEGVKAAVAIHNDLLTTDNAFE